MSYVIEFKRQAEKDIDFFRKSGNKILLEKLFKLLSELQENPYFGTGKPEKLKYKDGNVWSRRIDAKNRLIYEVFEDKIIVEIISVKGHYDDK